MLRFFAAFLLLDADQYVGRLAKLLQGHLAEAEIGKIGAHFCKLAAFGHTHLDQNSALEVDAEIKAAGREQANGEGHQKHREGKKYFFAPDEIQVGFDGNQIEGFHGRLLQR